MNTKDQILASNLSKTQKVIKLSQLGFTTTEIAEMIGSKYGFVWVVLKKRYPQNTGAAAMFAPVLFNRNFGIEIEAFGVAKEKVIAALTQRGIEVTSSTRGNQINIWKLTTDMSVDGRDSFELVSPILQGESGLEELQKVCVALKSVGARINKSCGLHVHIDARNFNTLQWKNVFKNYIMLEKTIDSFMPQSRRASHNTYCKTMGTASDILTQIDRIQNFEQLKSIYTNRYYKINIHSFFKFGTIEFRQHSGTIEFEKINNWVKFLHNLISFSEANVVSCESFDVLEMFNQAEIASFYAERIQELN